MIIKKKYLFYSIVNIATSVERFSFGDCISVMGMEDGMGGRGLNFFNLGVFGGGSSNSTLLWTVEFLCIGFDIVGLFITISFNSNSSPAGFLIFWIVFPLFNTTNKCVTELKIALSTSIDHPYNKCKAHPRIIKSIIILINWQITSVIIIPEIIIPNSSYFSTIFFPSIFGNIC